MASLSEAYPTPNTAAKLFEQAENPQARDQFAGSVAHAKEARHMLGLVGGSGVSRIAGVQADLESDLLGITRPTSWCAARHHLPPTDPNSIDRKTSKGSLSIDTRPVHQPAIQAWAYPSVIGPAPLWKETCSRPEKY